MTEALIFDCEFLTAEGAPARFWCGPYDPDPVVVQIGVVKLALEADFPLLETLRLHVRPQTRHGTRAALDPVLTKLTGITEDILDKDGVSLQEALTRTATFARGQRLWSWGKDEFNMVAISCYVAGLTPPLPATQFGNACALLLKAGMPYEDIKQTPSNRLAAYYQIDCPPLRAHDALDDARSVAYTVQHLLRRGMLSPQDLV